MSRQRDYIDRLPNMILTCQFIEEALKMYVWRADVMIHVAVKERIYWRGFGAKKLRKLPLGDLIREFERRSDRAELVASLKSVLVDRNFFAHEGYLLSHEPEECEKEAAQLLPRLEAGIRRAKECLSAVVQATCSMTGERTPEILKEWANQVPLPTPASVTPAADAPVAPPPDAAGL